MPIQTAVPPTLFADAYFTNYTMCKGSVRRMQLVPDAGAVSVSAAGLPAPTLTGSLESTVAGCGPFLSHRTTAASGNVASMVLSPWGGAAAIKPYWYPRCRFTVEIPQLESLSNVRYWIGLFSADPSGSSNPSARIAAFRFDTGVDGTLYWRAVSKATTGATPEVTETDVPVTAFVTRKFMIEFAYNTIRFWDEGTLVATHILSTGSFWSASFSPGVLVTTLANEIHGIKWGWLCMEHGFVNDYWPEP